MNIPIFDLNRQYLSLKDEIDASISSIINTSSYINGKENKLFEEAFAKYCGVSTAIGVSSGSAALDLVLRACGVSEGHEVICPSHTFAATAEAIVHVGATPVFIDIDENTYNLDPDKLKRAITSRTKAIIVVHLYGLPAAMDQITSIAKDHNLLLIEDAAQAHGAMYKGKRVGGFGDAACFSFFPAKNLGCYGDGGAVVTNNTEIADKIRLLKDHGRTSKYEHEIVGYGERLDNIQAAVLLCKLPQLDTWNQRRRAIASRYTAELASELKKPSIPDNSESVYYVYTLAHPDRDSIIAALASAGVHAGIYYPKPLHLQQAFSEYNYSAGDFPITEKVAKEIFSIPIYPELSDDEVSYIIETLNSIIK